MTSSADRPLYSTREVRQAVWRILRLHWLPLLLMLLVAGLPYLAADILDAIAEDYSRQAQAVYAACSPYRDAILEGVASEEYKDILFDLRAKEAQLSSTASELGLNALFCQLIGIIFAPTLIVGINAVLIAILRGQPHRWRDALSFRQFRRAMGLQCYLLLLLTPWELPGFLLTRIGNGVSSLNDTAGLVILLLARLLGTGLLFYARMRYLLAPRMLADGAAGAASELVSASVEFADRRSILNMLSILFPGLLMLSFASVMQRSVLPMLLTDWLSGLVGGLLSLLPYAYLLVASAAIYVTFKS